MHLPVWTTENIGALDMWHLQKGNQFIVSSGWFMWFILFHLLKTELLILIFGWCRVHFPHISLIHLKVNKNGPGILSVHPDHIASYVRWNLHVFITLRTPTLPLTSHLGCVNLWCRKLQIPFLTKHPPFRWAIFRWFSFSRGSVM